MTPFFGVTKLSQYYFLIAFAFIIRQWSATTLIRFKHLPAHGTSSFPLVDFSSINLISSHHDKFRVEVESITSIFARHHLPPLLRQPSITTIRFKSLPAHGIYAWPFTPTSVGFISFRFGTYVHSVSPKLSIILLSLPIISAQLCSLFIIRTFGISLHGVYAYSIRHYTYPIRYFNRWITLEYFQLIYQSVTITSASMGPLLRRLSLNMALHRPIPLNHSVFISSIHIRLPVLDFIVYTSGTSAAHESRTSLSVPLYIRRPSLYQVLSSFAVVRGSRSNISSYMLR